jgi:predicted ribosome quality control (RQC) complex YloA/Tae2 family protein
MENFAMIALAEALKASMGNIIIRRVVQHQPAGFIFHTRSLKLPALKVVVDMQHPAIYASEAKPPLDDPPSDFLMVLRKHLTSAELIEFNKPISERAFEMVFKTVVPSKELETMTLVLELIPNAPNILLLDVERRVLASFLPMTPQHGAGQFEPYSLPAPQGKLDLARVMSEDLPAHEEFGSQPDGQKWLISRIAGVGPVFAGEIVHRQKRSGRRVSEEIRDVLEQVRQPSHAAWIYSELPLGHLLEQNDLKHLEKAIVSPIELFSLERTHSSRTFLGILEAAKYLFDEIESRAALEQAKLPVLRELRTAQKRIADRERRLLREQQKYQEAETLQKSAQMLVAGGKKLDQRYESVTVTDYFGDTPKPVEIALDPAITLGENIQKMFKRHQKAGRGRQMVAQQLGRIRNRQATVSEQLKRLQAIRDWDTWLAVSSRIDKEKSNVPGESEPAEVARKRFRTVSIDGHEILIGRNSQENDEVTFRVAGPDDFWFHVAEYSGSHVVVRNPEKKRELDGKILIKAAQLAAYFSQARNSSKVEVHYTRRKHVAKPRRAKAGLVRLFEFKSVTVEPHNWVED